MIRVEGVSKYYGSFPAVRDVSFHVPKGQVVGLLGPNGAGKTTTIRMVTGFIPPTKGHISVNGFDTLRQTLDARRSLGYLPESTPLYPEMRVVDYLTFRARLFGVPARARRGAIAHALGKCWLNDVARKRIGQLSKGYKQRVGLAAALLHNPPVLVLDEPSSGLDPTQIYETRKLIRDLAKDRCVLVSSHILPEVERTCDRVLIIARGRLRADGTPGMLLADLERRVPPVHSVEVLADARSVSISGAGEAGGWGGEIARVMSNLRAIPGVASVRLDTMKEASGAGLPRAATADAHGASHWFRLTITPLPGFADLREPIARALARGLILCRDLRREMPTLEQLFTSIIEADEHPSDTNGAGPVAAAPGEQPDEEGAPAR